jgi:hypothetical protein
MTDLFTERLQQQVQDLPISLRSASAVRRDAERGQHRRRVAAATTVAVLAVAVGAGAVLGVTGDRLTGPPAEQTPTPTPTVSGPELDGAVIGVNELPSVPPFGAWTGSGIVTPDDVPRCLTRIWPQAAVSTVRRFTSHVSDQVGYQTVLTFESADETQSAAANALARMSSCRRGNSGQPQGNGEAGGGNDNDGYATWQVGTAAAPRSEIFVYAWKGQFLSLLLLSATGTAPLPHNDAGLLMSPLARSLHAATDGAPEPALDALPAAMLGPEDLPAEMAGRHPTLDTRDDPYAYSYLHPCDLDAAAGSRQRQVKYFGSRAGLGIVGQRVIIPASREGTKAVFDTVEAGWRSCGNVTGQGGELTYGPDLDLAGLGEQACGAEYEVRWPQPASGTRPPDHVFVAVVRTGRVVMQAVWARMPQGQDISAAQFQAMVRDTTHQLIAGVPQLADPTGETS